LSVSSQNEVQSDFIANNYLDGWASGGAATILGGDLNINVRDCGESQRLNQQYRGTYFGCNDIGYGPNREADQETTFGDTIYNETTFGGEKLDYGFFNYQRFDTTNFGADATSSTVSDHDPYRIALTIYIV